MMPRMLDLTCRACGHQLLDEFFMEVPDVIPCPSCGSPMDRLWTLPARERTQWDERDAVVVYRKPDGSLSYPGRNDRPTPSGCERVVLRSLHEVNKFERDHHVCCEAMHYDRNGRGYGDS